MNSFVIQRKHKILNSHNVNILIKFNLNFRQYHLVIPHLSGNNNKTQHIRKRNTEKVLKIKEGCNVKKKDTFLSQITLVNAHITMFSNKINNTDLHFL